MIGTARMPGTSYMNDHVPTQAADHAADEQLALGADVEQSGPEGERERRAPSR